MNTRIALSLAILFVVISNPLWARAETVNNCNEAISVNNLELRVQLLNYCISSESFMEDELVVLLKLRATTHSLLGRPYDAIADYSRTLKIDPEDVISLNNRGIAYKRVGEYAKAQADYREAGRLESKSLDAQAYTPPPNPDNKSSKDISQVPKITPTSSEFIISFPRVVNLSPEYVDPPEISQANPTGIHLKRNIIILKSGQNKRIISN